MTFYPVVIPTLNRFEHFRNCVESLERCTYADKTELIIGLDFPPSEKYIEGYKKIKEYIPSIKSFKNVICLERSENYGAAKNSTDLKDYAFQRYDACIYTEDDNIFSPAFLDFINKGLEKYKDDPNVVAVCGYSYPIEWETRATSVLQHQYFSAWGYGEWKDKMKRMYSDFSPTCLGKYLEKKNNRNNFRHLSDKNFRYAANWIFCNEIPFFDITLSVYLCVTGKNVLMPTESLVRNNGWDGSGVHCSLDDLIFSSQPICLEQTFSIFPVELVSKNLERFNRQIGNDYRRLFFVSGIKYILLSVFGYKNSLKIYSLLKKVKHRNC